VAQVVEHSSSKLEVLGSNLSTAKNKKTEEDLLSSVSYAYNPSYLIDKDWEACSSKPILEKSLRDFMTLN
jgi:hypothetical protein